MLFGLLFGSGILSLPSWSWDTIQTYVHCANYSGEWNDDALAVLAAQPFVVFEKYHKVFEEPVVDAAEAKIAESCRRVKALNPNTQCYMYTESDWARTEYSLGHWFVDNPGAALSCSPGTNDSLCDCAAKGCAAAGCKQYNLHYPAYDFSNATAREKWVERITNATATGHVDGAFIDGDRGGWSSSILGGCPAEKKAAWAAGLGLAVKTLAQRLGPDKTLISNYPTEAALAYCAGGMMERGGSSQAVQDFGKRPSCGLYNQPCLLDYHAQYFARPEDGKMAGFLLGVQKYGYFGGGSGWGGVGKGACKLWLTTFPEFSKKLGEPVSDMALGTAAWPGAVCDKSGAKRANTTGCLFTRAFASGTKVFAGQFLAPQGRNTGHCIYWSDGSVTTDNATRCMPKSAF